jgi:dolichol-phosphate mannosyltransferase
MDRNGFKSEKVVVIIPAFNEQGKTVKVVEAIPRDVVDEVVVINDGSTDLTPQEVARAGARVLHHEKRMGIGAAIRTGIKFAIENHFTVIVVMAGNGKDDPKQIPLLIDPIINANYDYIQGSRYLKGGYYGKMPLHRLLFTKIYSFSVRIFTGFNLTDGTNGFRAYRTAIFRDKRINLWQNWLDESLEYYLSIKVIQLGLHIKEVPVTKTYPPNLPYSQYTKVKPFIGWWQRLKPLFYLSFKLKT